MLEKGNRFRLLILIFWIMVLAYLIPIHTPWRDEFQSYLVSTRTETWPEFFEAVRYERHPPLHYLIQRGVHSLNLGLSPRYEILLATLPFTLGIAILLFFLNTSPFVYLGLLFSPYLLREHGIISRCYPIGGFLFLVGSYFRSKNKLWLFVLFLTLAAYTHLIFTLAALGWFFVSFYRKELSRSTLVIAGLLAIPALILQVPPADSTFPSSLSFSFKSVYQSIAYFAQTLLCSEIAIPYKWNQFNLINSLGFVLGLMFLVKTKRDRVLMPVLFLIFPTLFMVTSSYAVSSRYLGSFLWIFLGIYVGYNKLSILSTTLKFFALLSVTSCLVWILGWGPWQKVPNFNFSDSRNLAQLSPIQEANFILTNEDAILFPVMALLNKDIFHILRNKTLEYPYFRKSEYVISAADWCGNELSKFKELHPGQKIVWISQRQAELPPPCKEHLSAKPIYQTQTPTVLDEEYSVYELL